MIRINKKTIRKYEEGFTLTEMLVVLIIIGILVMLAVPRFTSLIRRTKMTEARLMLNQVYTLQHAYKSEFDVYSKSLVEIGFDQEKLITEGGEARYKISIESAGDTSFVALAESVVDFDDDGKLNVWQINHHKKMTQVVPD